MKPRILFVDDESNILQGLRRMLRSMRNEWDMDFAEGGEAALSKLSEQAFDVLVTDMKMPGVNGAELLDRVAALYPRMLRFILSGEADTDATFRTVITSHQFLPKPSNSERLIEIIKACLLRRDDLTNDSAQSMVTAVGCLATSRASHDALTALLDQESASIERAAEIFSDEPALTAKVMQLANSAYFGIGDPVSSPIAAANLLGWDVLRALLVNDTLIVPCPPGPCQTFYEQTAAHACDVGDLAAWIAEQQGAEAGDVAKARLAGLLHSLGRLLLCDQAPEDYARVIALMEQGKTAGQAEQDVFAEHHAAFGAYLAQIWGAPPAVVGAIRHHHCPSESPLSEDQQLPLLAAHTALGIVEGLRSDEPADVISAQLDAAFMERRDCQAKVNAWIESWRQQGSAA